MMNLKYFILGIIIVMMIGIVFVSYYRGEKEISPESGEYVAENDTALPQELEDYLVARKCNNGICEFQENNKNCPQDCLSTELRSDRWMQVSGPYGGWVTDLEKADSGLWIATSFSYGLGGNGVFEFTNNTTWKALGGTKKSMWDIAVDPNDARNIGFVGEDGLFITRDDGGTWQQIELEVEVYNAIVMSPANSSLIFVGTTSEGESVLFISQDDGEYWMDASSLPETEWSVKPIWAGVSDDTRNRITVIAPHPTNESIVLVGTNSALFKSTDKGQTWERIDSTFHRSDILDIEINPNDPNEIYVRVGVYEDFTCMKVAGMEDQAEAMQIERNNCASIYKSDDLGQTWKQLDAYYFDPSEGGVFVDDNNPNIAYAIFSRKILKTEDAGKIWREFFWTHDEPFIPNSGVERLAVGDNSNELFIAGRQGLWYSNDSGEHWHDKNSGFIGSEVVDIVKASDGTLYAGTYTLGMFKSTDGGMSWTFASYNLENPYIMLIAVDPKDPNTVFVTTNGGVYVSHDGALTWQNVGEEFFGESELLPGVAHFHGIAIDQENPDRIYIGGGGDQWTPKGAGMSISEDRGKTWRQVNTGFETDVHVSKIVINKNNPAIVYATTQGSTNFQEKTGNGYGVFKSTDYGNTWNKINSGLETMETNTLALDPNNQEVVYLGTDDAGMYKSSNGGTSWDKIRIPQLLENYGVGDIIVDPRDSKILYVATVDYFRLSVERGSLGDHGVYISRDGGASWESFNEGLEHLGAFALELDTENSILYVGTRGGGVYWRRI